MLRGTTIIGIRTPQRFIVAADGAGTFRGGANPDGQRQVRKVFESGGYLYGISGLTKDSQRGFDPETTIRNLTLTPRMLSDVANELETVISEALRIELLALKSEEPALFNDAIYGGSKGTTILLARWEGEPVTIGINFTGELSEDDELRIQTVRLSCPGDCPAGVYMYYLGHRAAIDRYMQHNQSISMSPEEMARFLVQLEIDAGTPGVGPPISVARLDVDGITWI